MIRIRRRVGFGTLSLLLIAIGIIWSVTINGFCLGDTVLQLFGLETWSHSMFKRVHYTVFYSLILIIPALILALRFENDLGATAGKFLSALIWLYLIFAAFNFQLF